MNTPYTPLSNSRSVSIGLIRGAKRSLDLEIPLAETHSERERCDSIAELYSIIVAINALEKSYIKDEFVQNEEYYTSTSIRLIKQFNLILENDEVKQEYGDLDSFVKRFDLNYPLAVKRIRMGMPATIEHLVKKEEEKTKEEKTKEEEGKNDDREESTGDNYKGKAIAEATGAIITLMDAIKLNYNTKEQLHPLLTDIVTATNKIFDDYDGRAKLVQWLIRLNNMKFDETLGDEDLKEFLWDVDTAYKGFFGKLA
ncbi:DEKNAAC103102 [Brettanomyces naardenensis]|uniref:Vacuolar protein sorting-associated protein 28 n=1 Tax=Brettanomyces naardenensis TaxID=13370 RepID=A0A448YMI9_BRENA|nr:DEKNAAC103102 [Brettanomyces naardenensis]